MASNEAQSPPQPQESPSSFQGDVFEPCEDPQPLNTLRHEPGLISCPSCFASTRTRIERVSSSNPRFWPFNLCWDKLPCLVEDCKNSVHKCGKCERPLATAKRNGHTEVLLPVAVKRNITREELSRPRSARLPNVPNFSRPGTASSRNILSPTMQQTNDFQSRFPPPMPDMVAAKDKTPLSLVIKKVQGMDGAGDSVVELPHLSPKSPKSLTRSPFGSSNESIARSFSPGSVTAPSESDIFLSIPPSPANFPAEPSAEKEVGEDAETETIHAR
jgi:hypothetical protein